MKKFIGEWSMFEKIWLSVFTGVILYLSYVWQDSIVGIVTSITGMLCVVLVAKGKISNYYFGIVNVALFAYLSYNQGFYGVFMLNAFYFLPMQFVGLWMWRKKSTSQKEFDVKVMPMSRKAKTVWGIVTVVAIAVYGYILFLLNGNLPIVDSVTTILQVLAMWFMVKAFKEQWSLWIVVNMVSIGMWLYAFATTGDDVSVLVMWVAYLVNSIYGYVKWNKESKEGVQV